MKIFFHYLFMLFYHALSKWLSGKISRFWH